MNTCCVTLWQRPLLESRAAFGLPLRAALTSHDGSCAGPICPKWTQSTQIRGSRHKLTDRGCFGRSVSMADSVWFSRCPSLRGLPLQALRGSTSASVGGGDPTCLRSRGLATHLNRPTIRSRSSEDAHGLALSSSAPTQA